MPALDKGTQRLMKIPKIKLQSALRSIIYLLTLSWAAGFLLSLLGTRFKLTTQTTLAEALLYGGSDGVAAFFIPALLAATLVATTSRTFKAAFKRHIFIALLATLATLTTYLIGITLSTNEQQLITSIIVGNALAYTTWFLLSFLFLGAGYQAIVIATIHPILNIAFLRLWQVYSGLEAASPWLLAPKLALASGIFLFAFALLFKLAGAPLRRAFGISLTQAITMLAAQALKGSAALEALFEASGERLRLPIAAAAFRSHKEKRLKALLLVPSVHYGPFGNLGGSEWPNLLSQHLSERFRCPTAALHSLVTHDMNPTRANDVKVVEESYAYAIRNAMNKGTFYSKATIIEGRGGDAKAAGFAFSDHGDRNGAIIFLTRAPKATEDVDYATGAILKEAASKKFGSAILADCHNSNHQSSRWVEATSQEFEDYRKAINAINALGESGDASGGKASAGRRLKFAPFRIGFAHETISATPSEGIGSGGVKAFVIEILDKQKNRRRHSHRNTRRGALLIVDANNALPSFRQRLLTELRKVDKFDWLELATTDTHAVNTLFTPTNPLGANAKSAKLLIASSKRVIREALKDMERCDATFIESSVPLKVFGTKRMAELITAVNAVVAVARLTAPLIFAGALIAAIASLLLVS